MTDDIAARLRRWSKTFGKPMGNGRTNPDNDMIYLLDDAADEIEALRAFRKRDKGEIESLRETVETLMHGSCAGELIDEANALRDDLRQATTKLGAAEARVRKLELEAAKLRRFLKCSRDEGEQALARADAAERTLAAMQPHIDKIARCAALNDEWGRVVTGQTDAARQLAQIAAAFNESRTDA